MSVLLNVGHPVGLVSYPVSKPCVTILSDPNPKPSKDPDIDDILKLLCNPPSTNVYLTTTPNAYYYIDKPYYVSGTYKDLDHDEDVIHTIVKYYYKKLLEYWITNHFIDLMGFLKIDNGKVSLISNMAEKSKEIDNSVDTQQKIIYLGNVVTKSLMKKWLKRFVEKENISWYKLQNHESKVREYVHDKIEKYLEDMITKI